jgi:chemotaxis signal transduction protein
MKSYVHFRIGGQDYILDANVSQYILSLEKVKFFSLAGVKKDYIKGLFIGRDKITTLAIYLSKFCNIEVDPTKENFLIAFSDRYAIIVDEVVNIFIADEKNFEPSPVKSRFVSKIYKDKEHGLLRELNIEPILQELNIISFNDV